MHRTDERDVIFSRMNYQKGDRAYADYYARHPEREAADNRLRSLPELGKPGSTFYDALNSPIVDATFRFLSNIKRFAEGEINPHQTSVDPETATKRLKGLAAYYGAKLVGVARMKEAHYYSHRGREEANYGQPVTDFHKHGIAFAVEMDKGMIDCAPRLAESIAVTKGYVNAAVIGMVLSHYIRELGYEARNHMDGNYLVVAPLAARDAGLGEIGRNGLLVTKEFGPRVRLGVVTTDLPLVCDEGDDWGLREFCDACALCAKRCPASAIPEGENTDDEARQSIRSDECYRRWRMFGTDCGVCLKACPFSAGVDEADIEALRSPDTRSEAIRAILKKHGQGSAIAQPPEWMK